MIKPLILGNTMFPVNLVQGPLAGVSCAPFRRLTSRYSQPAFSCTEMISCKTIIHQPLQAQKRYIQKDPEEGAVCFQLSGTDPGELAEAVKRVTDHGAGLIDLNCGCPVKKIRSRGAGSRLLADPAKLYQLIRAMKDNTHVPVSIKIRVDGREEKFNDAVAQAVSDAGADFLVVHGRHWTEHYETPCRHDAIAYFVDAMKIPVIGNGDVACVQSLKRMLQTGCAGVMIGRAGVGQPWLIRKLIAEIHEQPFAMPDNREIAAVFLEHVNELALLLESEKFAILQARTFAKYYARHLPQRADWHAAVSQCGDLASLRAICETYFKVSS